jgi:phospholipase C
MSISNMQKNIKHVVHLMLENRSFDHLLGWLRWNGSAEPKNHVPPLRANEQEFYGLTGNEWLPSNSSYFFPIGPFMYAREAITQIESGGSWDYCEMPICDPGEEFEHVTQQLYSRDGKTPMGYYIDYLTVYYHATSPKDILAVFTPETLPCLNTLAASYAVSDMWFSSVPTQTNPNRAFSLCGTSLGRINNNADVNTYKLCGKPFENINNIFSVFNAFNQNNPQRPPIKWKLYARYNWHDVSGGWNYWHDHGEAGALCQNATMGQYFTQYMFPKGFDNTQWGGAGSLEDFKRDVMQNTLPDFSYIEPAFFPQSIELDKLTDYHPPESIYRGEVFVREVFKTLTSNSAVWNNTLLIITFDEHGGTYDHLMPPENAIPPDDLIHEQFDFRRYGVRVPTLMISPWVTPGTIFRGDYYPEVSDPAKLPFDHTSVLATLCKWKGINYQNKATYPDYYLGNRTAAAPTFENVFTNTFNSAVPNFSPHNCSFGAPDATGAGLAGTGLVRRRELIRALTHHIATITGSSEADIFASGIVHDLLTSAQTAADLESSLAALGEKYKTP